MTNIETYEDLCKYGLQRLKQNNKIDPSLEKDIIALNEKVFTHYLTPTNTNRKTILVEFVIPKNIATKLEELLQKSGYMYIIFPHTFSKYEIVDKTTGEITYDESIGREIISNVDPFKCKIAYLVRKFNDDQNVFSDDTIYFTISEQPNGWFRENSTTIAHWRRLYSIDEPKYMVDDNIFNELETIVTPEFSEQLVGVMVQDLEIDRKTLYRELTNILNDIIDF